MCALSLLVELLVFISIPVVPDFALFLSRGFQVLSLHKWPSTKNMRIHKRPHLDIVT